MVINLTSCTFKPGCWDKKFVRDLAERVRGGHVDFSERQRETLLRLVHKYRRQIPTEILIIAQDEAERAAAKRSAS